MGKKVAKSVGLGVKKRNEGFTWISWGSAEDLAGAGRVFKVLSNPTLCGSHGIKIMWALLAGGLAAGGGRSCP